MEQKPLSWGKPQINIGIRTGGAAPSTWQKEHPVVEGTAKLTPTKGTKREAKVEGGENEAVMYTKNTYAFEYEVRVRDGREPIIEDVDGVVAGSQSADKALLDYARESGKKILEYQSPEDEDFYDNYDRFYEELF